MSYQKSHAEVELLIQTATAIRSIRQEAGLPANQLLPVCVYVSQNSAQFFDDIIPLIKRVARVDSFTFVPEDFKTPAAVARLGDNLLFIPLEGLIDLEKEKVRLDKKKIKIEKDITILKKSLEDPSFTQNAAPELIEEKNKLLGEAILELGVIVKAQNNFS